jgi:carbon storage regulator
MLVLNRETGQSIVIGDNAEIKIKILKNDGCFVRVGIEAPKHISIRREELLKKSHRVPNKISVHYEEIEINIEAIEEAEIVGGESCNHSNSR